MIKARSSPPNCKHVASQTVFPTSSVGCSQLPLTSSSAQPACPSCSLSDLLKERIADLRDLSKLSLSWPPSLPWTLTFALLWLHLLWILSWSLWAGWARLSFLHDLWAKQSLPESGPGVPFVCDLPTLPLDPGWLWEHRLTAIQFLKGSWSSVLGSSRPMALVIVKRLPGLASIPSFVYSASVHQLPTRSQVLPVGTACLALSQLLLGVGWGKAPER